MLLTGLQRQYIASLLAPALLNGLPNEASRQQAHEFLFGSHKAQGRCAIAHGIAEAHHFPNGDIGTIRSRRGQDAERGGFGDGGYEKRLAFMRNWFNGVYIFNATKEVRLLDDDGGGGWTDGGIKIFKGGHAIMDRHFFDR